MHFTVSIIQPYERYFMAVASLLLLLSCAPPGEEASISSIGPTVARANALVTIYGNGFGNAEGWVKFRGADDGSEPATIERWTNEQVLVRVPLSVRSGRIDLITSDLKEAHSTFSHKVSTAVAPGMVWTGVRMMKHWDCGLTTGHELYCWNSDLDAPFGTDRTGELSLVKVGDTERFRAFMEGNEPCAILRTGEIACWSFSSGVMDVNVMFNGDWLVADYDGDHGCAVDQAGLAWCWGKGATGQLGNGLKSNAEQMVQVMGDQRYLTIDVGGDTSCGIDTDSQLWCWGVLPNGEIASVPVLQDGHWLDIYVVGYFGVAVDSDGVLWIPTGGDLVTYQTSQSWREAVFGQIGANLFGGNTCAVEMDGSLWCWGEVDSYQLPSRDEGQSDPTPKDATGVPTNIPYLKEVTSVSIGNGICAVWNQGRLTCWGGRYAVAP